MYYTQEQIDRANQADLVSFLQGQGEQLIRAGQEYRWKQSYLALGGVGDKALMRFLSDRPNIKTVYLCLDSDQAGNDACSRLVELMPEGLTVHRHIPLFKDWNEVQTRRGEITDGKYLREAVYGLKEPPQEETVEIIRMSEVDTQTVECLWKPYIPFGKVTIVQGNPGEGKTTFALRLAAACTTGGALPGMKPMQPFQVIYQTAEDGLGDTVKPRLIEAAADLDRVLVIDEAKRELTLSDERIEKAIVQNGVRLIICGNYRQLTRDCTIHYIKTSAIEKLILTAIREVSAYVREDEKQFIRIVRDVASAGQEQTAKEQKKRLRQVEKRIAELDELIKKLYEGNATGKIPDKHFNRLLAEYDTEQSALEQEAAELKEGITAQAEDGMRAQRFVSLVRRYTSFNELTTPMLNEFIKKVVVHEADKSTGDRRQKVDIYFNFIGCFVPPKPEVILTAEEEAKAQKALAARNREREQNKLRMRRVREAQWAAKEAGKVSSPAG